MVNVCVPASLDQALSAQRINNLQVRALCELQQQAAEAALKIQQLDAQIQQLDAQIELMRTPYCQIGLQSFCLPEDC